MRGKPFRKGLRRGLQTAFQAPSKALSPASPGRSCVGLRAAVAVRAVAVDDGFLGGFALGECSVEVQYGTKPFGQSARARIFRRDVAYQRVETLFPRPTQSGGCCLGRVAFAFGLFEKGP